MSSTSEKVTAFIGQLRVANQGLDWYDELEAVLTQVENVASGTAVPTAGTAGYNPGAIFTKTDAVNGQCANWYNGGTAASCAFYPMGPVLGYGAAWGMKRDDKTGNAATTYNAQMLAAGDILFANYAQTDDTDHLKSAAHTESLITVTGSADGGGTHSYAMIGLRTNCIPNFEIVAAGTRASLTADDATIAITVAGVLTTDICFATVNTNDGADQVCACAVTADGTLTITASIDPGADDAVQWNYIIMRPRGAFAPSHYIFAAGERAAVTGDDATIEVTVADMLATDLVFCMHKVNGDTDTINSVASGAGKFTITASADPETNHTYAYFVVRAY